MTIGRLKWNFSKVLPFHDGLRRALYVNLDIFATNNYIFLLYVTYTPTLKNHRGKTSNKGAKVDWQFTAKDVRIKLCRIYPTLNG